jgi:hypothetical protein
MPGWMPRVESTDFAEPTSRVRVMVGARHYSAEASARVLTTLVLPTMPLQMSYSGIR